MVNVSVPASVNPQTRFFTIVFQATLEIFILVSQRVIFSLYTLQDIPGYKSWNAAMAPVNDVQTTG